MNRGLNIAFLGGLFPEHLEKEVLQNSRGDIQYAASNLQWAIIKGLDQVSDKPVHICTVMLLGSWPGGFNKLIIPTENFSHFSGASDTSYGFFNFRGISIISRFCAAKRGIFRWCRNTQGEKAIICYSAHTPHLLAAAMARKRFSVKHLCLVVTDLPELMSDKKNLLYRFMKRIDGYVIRRSMKFVDSFVLLAPDMANRLPIENRKSICMEGIFDTEMIENIDVKKDSKKVVLYAGILELRHGLATLIEAFGMISEPGHELWICGDGNDREEILGLIKNDDRIKYLGLVDRRTVLNLQRRARVLVNPRPSRGEFTRYSFPSKTLEYMASGTPVIMNRLSSVPGEYFKYCFVPETEDAAGLKDAILKVTSLSDRELEEFGMKARKFITENKNPHVQGSKIYNLITSHDA